MKKIVGCALVISLVLVSGCHERRDIATRYMLERALQRAQRHEQQIDVHFLQTSRRDIGRAVAAYSAIARYEAPAPGAIGWDPSIADDVRRILLASRIALANLHFLGADASNAGGYYRETLEGGVSFGASDDLRLDLVRAISLAGDEHTLAEEFERLFADVSESDEFWNGRLRVSESFLNVPLVLVRLYRDREDETFADTADRFYARVQSAWPDSAIAPLAARSRVQLLVMRERWPEAIAMIDTLSNTESLALLKGEILAFAIGDVPAGTLLLRSIAESDAHDDAVYVARYDLASLLLRNGSGEDGDALLRDLETESDVPGEIAARAMLARARHLEKQEQWDQALPILRRIGSMYPHTEAAADAPLFVTRHYMVAGDPVLAERSLEKATAFYISLMERGSGYARDRLAIEDYLIRNYLMMDRAQELARLLEAQASGWEERASAGSMLKGANIYRSQLQDDESAARVLKKCIEMFPETRYAKTAGRQLAELNAGQTNGTRSP